MMKIPVIIPTQEVLALVREQLEPVFDTLYIKQKESSKLTELQSLLLAKMGKSVMPYFNERKH